MNSRLNSHRQLYIPAGRRGRDHRPPHPPYSKYSSSESVWPARGRRGDGRVPTAVAVGRGGAGRAATRRIPGPWAALRGVPSQPPLAVAPRRLPRAFARPPRSANGRFSCRPTVLLRREGLFRKPSNRRGDHRVLGISQIDFGGPIRLSIVQHRSRFRSMQSSVRVRRGRRRHRRGRRRVPPRAICWVRPRVIWRVCLRVLPRVYQ